MTTDVIAVAVTGTWWRHLPAGDDPAHRSERPADGRWQRGNTVAALYLAGDADTCRSEWYWLILAVSGRALARAARSAAS